MPIKQELREYGRLLYWEFTDPWSLDELIPPLNQANQYVLEAQQSIYSFVDARESRLLPRGIISLPKLGELDWKTKFGAEVVLVIQSAAVKAMIQLLFRLAHSQRAVIFDDYQVAWQYMQQLLESSASPQENQQENKAGSE